MKVDKINEYKSVFSEHLASLAISNSPYEEGYKWDAIHQWKESIDLSELDISPYVQKAMTNDFSGRLWGGERFSIKSSILELIKENPLYMQSAFKDLFNEEFDISMRMNRFVLHCDQVLEILNKKDDRYNDHRQSSYSASLFLALHIPDKYGLFQYEEFYKFMEKVESRNIPLEQDKERYFKILNAIHIVLFKDVEFMNGVSFLLKDRGYSGKSLFLVNDFILFSNAL